MVPVKKPTPPVTWTPANAEASAGSNATWKLVAPSRPAVMERACRFTPNALPAATDTMVTKGKGMGAVELAGADTADELCDVNDAGKVEIGVTTGDTDDREGAESVEGVCTGAEVEALELRDTTKRSKESSIVAPAAVTAWNKTLTTVPIAASTAT